jgi:hypothetical protein
MQLAEFEKFRMNRLGHVNFIKRVITCTLKLYTVATIPFYLLLFKDSP